MLADFLAYVWPALPAFMLAGFCFVVAGTIWLVAIRRHELALGPDPVLPPVVHAEFSINPAESVAPNYRRPDSDTGVVPRIPGATPEAGPVCPFCGGPWHALCPSAPKEGSDETVEIPFATEPVPPPVKPLAPEFAALSRFFTAVDQARADTDQAMGRLVDDLASRDDCPLTTQEIPPLEPSTPTYDAAIRNTDTRELSEVWKKVSAP